MPPLQDNRLMQAIIKAVNKGNGRKAIAMAARKDKKLGMKVKNMVKQIFSLQTDLSRLKSKNPDLYNKFDDIWNELD